ncbi:MAG: tripartite tricarboxylate transporter substrate binding protein [Burkholderiales bacterium]|nr:tripartite tricarboxylate transporter substrate binding protein [Burkholderiales bacterium]
MNPALFRIALAVFAAALLVGNTAAQDWPARQIRLIVPFTPGTGQDIIARTLGPKLTERFGQSVVIENRAGASGNIGTEAVAKSPPDGYTLLLTASPLVFNPLIYQGLSWDPYRDLAPVANLTDGYLALVVNNNVPATNVKEFVALLKARPGRLSYASPGVGTPQHLTGELFKVATGTFMLHVPYRGSAGAVTDVIGGAVEAMFMPVHTVLPQARQGRLKVLGVAFDKRVAVAPEVPTIHEAGGPRDVNASVWYAMFAPAKTPPEIVNRLSGALRDILRMADVADTLNKQGLTVNYLNPQELTAMMRGETARWAKIVKEKGLKGE